MKKNLFLCLLATGLGVYSLASALPVNDLKRSAAKFQGPFQQKLMQKIAEAKKKSSSHSHHHKQKCFFHLFSLGTMDSTFLVNDTSQIDITAEVCVKDERVSLTIPSFSFEIPLTSLTPRDGYVYTIPSTNLPKSVWHSQGLPYSIPCASNCTLYVFNDGAIVIGGADFQPLVAGTYTVNQTTISYELDEVCPPPKNFKISDKTATVTNDANNLLDFYNNDFYGETIAYTFSANPPSDVTNSSNVNFYAVVGKVKNDKVTLGPVKALYVPDDQPEPQLCLENTISINPKNPKNLVATTIYNNRNVPVDSSFNRLTFLRSYTFDGGNTWTTDQMTGDNRTAGFGLPEFRSDPNGQFDDYGNYWLTYMTTTDPTLQPPFGLVFAVSTDGGITFTEVGTATAAPGKSLDYPRLTFGGDGIGGKALWFSSNQLDDDIGYFTDIIIGYIPVSGRGSYGALNYGVAQGLGKDVATDSISYLQVPEITATPEGDVYLFGPTQIYEGDNGNYTKEVLAKHTGGIINFTQFETPIDVYYTNVGGNDFNTSSFGKPIPFQPDRGVFGNAARGIDYDHKSKKLWISGINIKPNNFSPVLDTSPGARYDMSIFTMHSEDGGRSWSPERQVSQQDILDRALPSLKVNQKTGEKALFWYDGQDDSTGVSVKPFGTVFK